MTRIRTLILILAATLLPGADTWAAEAARQDTSGLFVWAFLGLCALIIAAQVIPALLMMVGAARGVAEGLQEKRGAVAHSETETR